MSDCTSNRFLICRFFANGRNPKFVDNFQVFSFSLKQTATTGLQCPVMCFISIEWVPYGSLRHRAPNVFIENMNATVLRLSEIDVTTVSN